MSFSVSNFTANIILAFLLRLALIYFSLLQDKWSRVKYTDVDYDVFSRAGQTVQGLDRASLYGLNPTFRYPPAVAHLFGLLDQMSPWSYFPSPCKVLFAACDILAALALKFAVSLTRGAGLDAAIKYLWLYNPLVMAVSTRGNFDGAVCCLLAWSLWAMSRSVPPQKPSSLPYLAIAALLYGSAIHLRLFPVVLAPTFYAMISRLSDPPSTTDPYKSNYANLLGLRPQHVIFGCVTFLTVFTLTDLSYYYYGWQYLYQSILYHVTRSDYRHNFSPHFYPIYLGGIVPPSGAESVVPACVTWTALPVPILAIVIPLRMLRRKISESSPIPIPDPDPDLSNKYYHGDFVILQGARAMFCVTLAFVAFNKVFTSQYFTWPLIFAPFAFAPCFHYNGMGQDESRDANRSTLICILCGWCLTKGAWLLAAYLLEFRGYNTFLLIWVNSLLFMVSNVTLICYALLV